MPPQGSEPGFRVWDSVRRAQQGAPRFLKSRVPGLQVKGLQRCTTQRLHSGHTHTHVWQVFLHMRMHASICSSIHLSVYSSIYSFVLSSIRSFMLLCIHTFIHTGIHIHDLGTRVLVITQVSIGVEGSECETCGCNQSTLAQRMLGEMASDCACRGHGS